MRGATGETHFDLSARHHSRTAEGARPGSSGHAAIAGGAGCIQLRAKKLGKRELLREARTLRKITRDAGVTFMINDHIDIALTVEADGVHLGQDDFPIPEARRIVGPAIILGASTHSVEEALQAEREGASYINVGPVFATQTKEGVGAPVGVELVAQVKAAVHTPQTCMGGIKLHNVREVVLAGAERIAVVSEVVSADDIAAAARALVEAIGKQKRKNN
jgi:thiamine-phosphate pyrophosphorylase